tara:strand:+ start:898 stop:1335 length:438 start_codon:yes stop_codon:yes gene_type:complete
MGTRTKKRTRSESDIQKIRDNSSKWQSQPYVQSRIKLLSDHYGHELDWRKEEVTVDGKESAAGHHSRLREEIMNNEVLDTYRLRSLVEQQIRRNKPNSVTFHLIVLFCKQCDTVITKSIDSPQWKIEKGNRATRKLEYVSRGDTQ